MNIRSQAKRIKGFTIRLIQKFRYHPISYFTAIDKVYLASADQFKGMEKLVEGSLLLQCENFYSVIGGMGGLSILARLNSPSKIHFFDINPHTIQICDFIIRIISISENRDDFISWIYARPFKSDLYNCKTQKDFYDIPIDSENANKIEKRLGAKYREIYEKFYIPYIENPLTDIYDGVSLHCTRMPVFHEAKADGVMTYPFIERKKLRKKKIQSVNSFFFGKGWLKDEQRFQRVKLNLESAEVSFKAESIFDISPEPNAGLYASNVLEGNEKQFKELTNRFIWTLWYSQRSRYLQLEYVNLVQRLIPFKKVYGRGTRDTHRSCCELIDEAIGLGEKNFLEVIEPHITEEMNYGFRFYKGQKAINVSQFLDKTVDKAVTPDFLGIHILMGGGCPTQLWKAVVEKALSFGKTVFIFEHRKSCNDWPEWDVNPDDILSEKEIDAFLLTLRGKWEKFGTANRKGQPTDVRNICWITRV